MSKCALVNKTSCERRPRTAQSQIGTHKDRYRYRRTRLVCLLEHRDNGDPTAARHTDPRREHTPASLPLPATQTTPRLCSARCAVSQACSSKHRALRPRASAWRTVAMSFFYFRRSARTGHVQPTAWIPPVWGLKAVTGELPPLLTELFRNAWDSELTGGRNTMQQP